MSTVLSLYNASAAEDSLAVWTQIATDLGDLTPLVQFHPMFSTYQAFLKSLFVAIVEKGKPFCVPCWLLRNIGPAAVVFKAVWCGVLRMSWWAVRHFDPVF